MALLTIEPTEVAAVKVVRAYHGTNGESLARGDYARLDPTSGAFVKGNATAAGEVGVGAQRGIVYEVLVGSVRVMGAGILDVGDALDALDFDDPVYLSDTDSTLADTAGTVSTVAGTVVPGHASTTPDKLLEVSF